MRFRMVMIFSWSRLCGVMRKAEGEFGDELWVNQSSRLLGGKDHIRKGCEKGVNNGEVVG